MVVRRLDDLSFDQLAKFDSVQALHIAMYGNMSTNEAWFITGEVSKLKNEVVTLKSKHDVLRVRSVEGSFQRCRGFEEKKSTFLSTEDSLRDEIDRISLVKDSLPSAVKKLMASNHFSLAMADLEQKAMMFGMAHALNDVLGLGDSWKLEDIKDYDPGGMDRLRLKIKNEEDQDLTEEAALLEQQMVCPRPFACIGEDGRREVNGMMDNVDTVVERIGCMVGNVLVRVSDYWREKTVAKV
ncbi:hypothetical protein Tco_0566733 [Tanacetum coccineum]